MCFQGLLGEINRRYILYSCSFIYILFTYSIFSRKRMKKLNKDINSISFFIIFIGDWSIEWLRSQVRNLKDEMNQKVFKNFVFIRIKIYYLIVGVPNCLDVFYCSFFLMLYLCVRNAYPLYDWWMQFLEWLIYLVELWALITLSSSWLSGHVIRPSHPTLDP